MKIFAPQKNSGFTLIELMITIVVIAILLNTAVPSMRDFMQNQSIISAITLLSSDVKYARSEAVDKKTSVEICPSNNGTSCASTNNWANGWMVYISEASDCPAVGQCVLRVRQPIGPLVSLHSSINEAIAFDASGASNANASIALCRADSETGNNIFLRTLEVKNSGSSYIRKGVTTCNPS